MCARGGHRTTGKAVPYTLQSHPSYWFHVGVSPSAQVIVGFVGQGMCAVGFTHTGAFVDVKRWPLAIPPGLGDSRDALTQLYALVDAEVLRYRETEDLRDEPVRIAQFTLPEGDVRIETMPEEFLAFRANPDDFDRAEWEDLCESIDAWLAEEQYVFYWGGGELWVASDGLVSTS